MQLRPVGSIVNLLCWADYSGGHDQDAFPDDARDAGAAGQLGTMLVADGGASGEEEVPALPVCYRYTGLLPR